MIVSNSYVYKEKWRILRFWYTFIQAGMQLLYSESTGIIYM